MSDALLRLRHVRRTYRGRTVLDDITLDVSPGEIYGLIGPNGGGKSTLLLLMAGLVRPSDGTVTVGGVPAHELARARTGEVGLITALPGLYPLLTGQENLRFFGALFGLSGERVSKQAAPLLDELQLASEVDRPVSELSSGMQQKLSLVRALLLSPRLLLLDEPTANLDPVAAHALYTAVQRRAEHGMAVVIATHDLVAAERLCHCVGLLDRNVIETEVFAGPRSAPEPGRLLALLQRRDGLG